MDYELRPASADDYAFLYRLHAATIREAVAATWGWDEDYQRQRFRENFDPACQQIVVVDGADAGVVKTEDRDGPFLGLIEILPRYQGLGLGTRIIRDLLEQAHGRGEALTLHVLKANPRARALYERLGFHVIEEREVRYVMRAPPPEP
jgi:ribosomal protein S18 acetylase RimI-like enzyme